VERLLRVTEPFTWDDVPTRDPNTGRLTIASWIGRINTFAQKISILLVFIHFLYIFFRSISSEGRLLQFNTWYPFETLTSPQYEFVNAAQASCPNNQHYRWCLCADYHLTQTRRAPNEIKDAVANKIHPKQSNNLTKGDKDLN
jgi:hypothetical protein